MTKLRDLEKAMRPQFIWAKFPEKPLQLNEEYEGAKDLARMIFVGIADIHGFGSAEIMTYLDMEYESYRNKLSRFRQMWREAKERENDGCIRMINDIVKRFYYKVSLCLNYIDLHYKRNSYIKMEDWVNNE